jgi:hypothetical protein
MLSPTDSDLPGGNGTIASELRPRSTSEILCSLAGKVFMAKLSALLFVSDEQLPIE